jgi:DNA topoisomerase-3
MKKMVDDLVYEVRSETTRANISQASVVKQRQAKTALKKKAGITSETCPKCQKGTLIKGKTAYGCSAYKDGCKFILPFEVYGKKISEKQFLRLLQKGSTVNLKGFKTDSGTAEGLLRFDEAFQLILEPKKVKSKPIPDKLICPKCKKGNVIKGKTAYGCSAYKEGCDFRFSFEDLKKQAGNKALTKELVYTILNKSH